MLASRIARDIFLKNVRSFESMYQKLKFSIDKKYRYEKNPFVYTNRMSTNAVFQKKACGQNEIDRKIYHDLFMF